MVFLEFYEYFLFSFITIIVIVNPLPKIIIFPPLLVKLKEEDRLKTVKKATIIALSIFLGASLIGDYLFSFLNIELFSLKITGGVILFYIAFKMITGREKKKAEEKAQKAISQDKKNIAFSPLAFPLMVGPATSAMGIILFTQAPDLFSKIGFLVAGIVVYVINYIAVINSNLIKSMLGEEGTKVMGKIVGILIAAIGIQLIVIGLREAFGIIM